MAAMASGGSPGSPPHASVGPSPESVLASPPVSPSGLALRPGNSDPSPESSPNTSPDTSVGPSPESSLASPPRLALPAKNGEPSPEPSPGSPPALSLGPAKCQAKTEPTEAQIQDANQAKLWIWDPRLDIGDEPLPTEDDLHDVIIKEVAGRTRKDWHSYFPTRRRIAQMCTVMELAESKKSASKPSDWIGEHKQWSQWAFHIKQNYTYREGIIFNRKSIPVTPIEECYTHLVRAHVTKRKDGSLEHRGRDSTYSEVKKWSSTITKVVVQNFIQNCPKCRGRQQVSQKAYAKRDAQSRRAKKAKAKKAKEPNLQPLDQAAAAAAPQAVVGDGFLTKPQVPPVIINFNMATQVGYPWPPQNHHELGFAGPAQIQEPYTPQNFANNAQTQQLGIIPQYFNGSLTQAQQVGPAAGFQGVVGNYDFTSNNYVPLGQEFAGGPQSFFGNYNTTNTSSLPGQGAPVTQDFEIPYNVTNTQVQQNGQNAGIGGFEIPFYVANTQAQPRQQAAAPQGYVDNYCFNGLPQYQMGQAAAPQGFSPNSNALHMQPPAPRQAATSRGYMDNYGFNSIPEYQMGQNPVSQDYMDDYGLNGIPAYETGQDAASQGLMDNSDLDRILMENSELDNMLADQM